MPVKRGLIFLRRSRNPGINHRRRNSVNRRTPRSATFHQPAFERLPASPPARERCTSDHKYDSANHAPPALPALSVRNLLGARTNKECYQNEPTWHRTRVRVQLWTAAEDHVRPLGRILADAGRY